MQQPILDRIVVKPDTGEEMFGSIHIPESAIESADRGTVVMVGPGKVDEPIGVDIGDKVIYSTYAGTQITIDDEDFLVMRWHDCLMRFSGEGK